MNRFNLIKDVFENANRRAIYTFIKEHPLSSISDIYNGLDMKFGSVNHHIAVLENYEYIKYKKIKGKKKFYAE